MNTNGPRWKRLLGEGLVILASVYLAIVLEGRSDDRQRTEEAIDALVQLRAELRADRADLTEVMAEQANLDRQYARLDGWLADPASLPADSFTALLDSVAFSNRTMFPRSSAWTTMVTSGQLRFLRDPALVTHLANLYENVNPRIEYNGEFYDRAQVEVVGTAVPLVWDSGRGRFLTGDADVIAGLRGRLRYLHVAWNGWYLMYLGEYVGDLESRIRDVEAYLETHGHGD